MSETSPAPAVSVPEPEQAVPRVAVLGAGGKMGRHAVPAVREAPGLELVAELGAQTYAIGFYEKLGFTACGPEYDDAGIPHRDMSRDL